jgi:hypothetical protein
MISFPLLQRGIEGDLLPGEATGDTRAAGWDKVRNGGVKGSEVVNKHPPSKIPEYPRILTLRLKTAKLLIGE